MAGIVQDEARHDPARGFVGGYELETLSLDLPFMAAFPTPPYPGTHNLGTNRMSGGLAKGVCNKWGQTHGTASLFTSDGSQFTTEAAENPTLTIVAPAIRQADHIAKEMGAGTI
jgi:choline dehydrogenase-like flavoprotein